MSIRLVKTVGGENGAPSKCNRCESVHFAKSGVAWHCVACGVYYPTQLGFDSLKRNLEHAQRLMKDFKNAINDLEHIVRE